MTGRIESENAQLAAALRAAMEHITKLERDLELMARLLNAVAQGKAA